MMPNFITGKSECHHCGYNVTRARGSTCNKCAYLKHTNDNEYLFCEMHGEIKTNDSKSCIYYS